jgi:hypothetical protein
MRYEWRSWQVSVRLCGLGDDRAAVHQRPIAKIERSALNDAPADIAIRHDAKKGVAPAAASTKSGARSRTPAMMGQAFAFAGNSRQSGMLPHYG